MNPSNRDDIHIIYAGGTFGCYGTPLSALPPHKFIPSFLDTVNLPNHRLSVLDNDIVKDSSQLDSNDFLRFYQLIKQATHHGKTKFLLITGTDTLAYLAAFLAIALKGLPIYVVVTGSMLPFFDPITHPYTKNTNSDAWGNFLNATQFLQKGHLGVYVSFYGQVFYGDSVQKIHATDKNAFSGIAVDNSKITPAPQKPLELLHNYHSYINIHIIYCLPNVADNIAEQLSSLLKHPPTAVILIGFGAGNMPVSEYIKLLIKELIDHDFLVIMATACPFGDVSDSYAAGAWQYELGVISAKTDKIPKLYAKSLWLCLTHPPCKRKHAWDNL